jgi:hypothetical protein
MTGDRYRYRVLATLRHTLLLRDDGFRIWFLILAPELADPEQFEWFLWADYKQCDLPGPAEEIADALMEQHSEKERA